MRKSEKWFRTRAISLVRKELLYRGYVPHRVSSGFAAAVLDSIVAEGGELYDWYMQAGDVTLNKWSAEWIAWAHVEIDYEVVTSGIETPKPFASQAGDV